MTENPWTQDDFLTALQYLVDHEEQARETPILDTGAGVTVFLPAGLPGLGVSLPGALMLAPILLFMVVLLAFPFIIFGPDPTVNLSKLGISALALGLFGGLVKVLGLMTRNRDHFPRQYFVTSSRQGLAMHFSPLHLPGTGGRSALPWDEIEDVTRIQTLFLPAILKGILEVPALEVTSRGGTKILIPVSSRLENPSEILDQIESRIRQKIAP